MSRSGSRFLFVLFFFVSAIFMKPLFAEGFWTSYNRLFGSMEHLTSEYHKSEALLKEYSRIEVQGTEPFLYLEDQLNKKGSVMKMDYPKCKELLIIEYSQAKSPTLPTIIDDKIRQLQSDIEQLGQADANQYR